MAINRGTRKATFVHLVETFAMLGMLAGAGWGVFQTLGGNPFDILMNAIRTGLLGFIGGTLVGVLLGVVTVIYLTIFD
jgi:ABC-type lipoprotein release transport system permease subunit